MFLATGKYSQRLNGCKENAMPKLGHGCLKLRPLPMDKFRVVACLDKSKEDAVSFEFCKRPGWFIRAHDRDCFIEMRLKDTNFEIDCSFYPLLNLWYQDYAVFESTRKAASYLRMKDGRMVLDHYDTSIKFKQESSFRHTKTKGELLSYREEMKNQSLMASHLDIVDFANENNYRTSYCVACHSNEL